MYLGEINHRDKSYPGEHAPIIDPILFEAVQTKLTENCQGRRLLRQSSNTLLMGKLFDDRGNPMTPSYAIKKGVRYRFYVSCVLNQGRKEEAGIDPAGRGGSCRANRPRHRHRRPAAGEAN